MTALALARQVRRRGRANALHDLDGLGVIDAARLYYAAATDLSARGPSLIELYRHAMIEAGYLLLGGEAEDAPSCPVCGYIYPTPL